MSQQLSAVMAYERLGEVSMLVKTILNRLQRCKGFVYGRVRFVDNNACDAIEIEVSRRAFLDSST